MKDKITYSKCGDYYLPDLTVSDIKEYIIGKYGNLRRQFLKEHHKSYCAIPVKIDTKKLKKTK